MSKEVWLKSLNGTDHLKTYVKCEDNIKVDLEHYGMEYKS
jgi:hypothetical protein